MAIIVNKSQRGHKGHVKKAHYQQQEASKAPSKTPSVFVTEAAPASGGSADIYAGRFPRGLVYRPESSSALKWQLAKNTRISEEYTGFGLTEAARLGDVQQVQTLLNHGADPNAKSASAERIATPLQCAAYHGHTNIMALLMERGARVSQNHGAIGTALHAAAMSGTPDACHLLLSHGAYINKDAGKCGTPLHAAGYGRNIATMRFLLSRGASFSDYAPWGSCRWAELSPEYQQEVLEDIMSDMSTRYDDIVEAAQWGATRGVKARLIKGDRVNMQDELLGRTPLHWAAANGDTETIKLCLEHGANEDVKDKLGLTPKMTAYTYNNRMDVVSPMRTQGSLSAHEAAVATKLRLVRAFDNLAF